MEPRIVEQWRHGMKNRRFRSTVASGRIDASESPIQGLASGGNEKGRKEQEEGGASKKALLRHLRDFCG